MIPECPRRDERGSASVEALLLVPVIVLVVACLVGGARVWFARSVVADAAQSGARAATLERSAGPAEVRARRVVAEALQTRGLRCSHHSVTVATGGFARPVGTPASVQVEATCHVPLADLGLPVPGTLAAHGRGVSGLDTYRGRR